MNLKEQKNQEESKRDRMQQQMCDEFFQRQVRDQRMREIQQREMTKKVAEDNYMIAGTKRKQEMERSVREKMQLQQAISESKVKAPTMVR